MEEEWSQIYGGLRILSDWKADEQNIQNRRIKEMRKIFIVKKIIKGLYEKIRNTNGVDG